MPNTTIVRLALPVPLRKLFDYRTDKSVVPGARVIAPFGKQSLTGIVVEITDQSDLPVDKLKFVSEVIDQSPLLPDTIWQLLSNTANYYHHPLGETLATALPNALMKGAPCKLKPIVSWQATETGIEQWSTLSARAVRMINAMQLIIENGSVTDEVLRQKDTSASTLQSLMNKGWLKKNLTSSQTSAFINTPHLELNCEQQHVVGAIKRIQNRFHAMLLEGVTGSGKTEVYLQSIQHALETGKQALVLIPEIGLTPQTLKRFEQRFPGQVGVLHSGLTDQQRLHTWIKARDGLLRIVIGTRSAIFTPLRNPGIIIVDEEHDLSFKQQEGLRYSSRDLALMRGKLENIPVILGSATPSLESLKNAQEGKYQHLKLTQRAKGTALPQIHTLDCRSQPLYEGFSQPLLNAMQAHLNKGNQVLVFINRRGFAPVLLCHRCGWIADCSRCDRYMTLHQAGQESTGGYLQCHHCGTYKKRPPQCPKCEDTQLLAVGQGTERVEQTLKNRFPDKRIQRIDRDTTRRKKAMSEYVEAAKSGETQILIGTQMIAKGHHFPRVSLVAILDMDGALFSSDFRAPERAAQLITQVAGRAGRADIKGEVLIQTHHPEHALLALIKQNDYSQLTQRLLADRQAALLPPETFMALFRAESHNKEQANEFLQLVARLFVKEQAHLEVMGPVASTISRKSGRYRFQLLINSANRQLLHQSIRRYLPEIEKTPLATKVRWSLDIDPQDLL